MRGLKVGEKIKITSHGVDSEGRPVLYTDLEIGSIFEITNVTTVMLGSGPDTHTGYTYTFLVPSGASRHYYSNEENEYFKRVSSNIKVFLNGTGRKYE